MRYFAAELRALPRPVKVYYYGSVFRYDEPQKGRYREFWQFGVELIGADTPEADAEVIALAHECIASLGIEGTELRVGNVGLVRALVALAKLDDGQRQAVFPLIDKKDGDGLEAKLQQFEVAPALRDLLVEVASFRGGTPELAQLSGRLGEVPAARAAVERLLEVLRALEARKVPAPIIDLGVVRGLDYYSGVVFEFHSPNLGAESQCAGGGAYSLTDVFEMPYEGTSGFGLGFDRLAMLVPDSALPVARGAVDVLVVPIGDSAAVKALSAQCEVAVRAAGARVERDLLGRGPSKSLKYADARGARFAVLIGEKEAAGGTVTVRDLKSGRQSTLGLDAAVMHLQSELGCA